MKLAALLAVSLLAASAADAQRSGDFVFGIAIGTGERAGLFARFYPVSDVGAEAHLYIIPLLDLASGGAGLGLVVHPLGDERASLYVGGSAVGGTGGRRYGADLSAGYEGLRGADLADRLLVWGGLSLVRQQSFGRGDGGYEESSWSGWLLRPGVQVGTGRVTGAVDEP